MSLAAGCSAALLAALPLQPGAAARSHVDWPAYLADGVRDLPSRVPMVRASRAAYRQEIAAPAIQSAFVALFLRGDRTALLYDGMILEPQIHDLGFSFLDGTPLSAGGPSYGLVPVRVRLR